jgi:DNA invertase Pin-like site-specific DNA recombinase
MPPYAYLRRSVQRVDDPRNSFEAQRAAVLDLASRHGDVLTTECILSDENKSGKLGRDKRPGFDALWRAIEDGSATAVYSYSMSRLARSVAELQLLFEACSKRKIAVRLEADVIDTSTASGRLVAGIIAQVAAFEADVTGERMRAALEAKRDRGESLRSVPYYGDRLTDKDGNPTGEDADAVLATFRECHSFNATARLLNDRGVPTRRGRPWKTSAVAVMLHRMDPTIPRAPKGKRAGDPPAYRFAGLLVCPTCGKRLTGITSRTRAGVPYARYVCTGRNDVNHPRATIAESIILPAVMAEVAHLRTPDAVEIRESDAKDRAELDSRRSRILDMREAGQIDRAECDARLRAVSEALGRLDASVVILSVPAIDWTLPPSVIRPILAALFERITLDPLTFEPLPDGYVWRVPQWRA